MEHKDILKNENHVPEKGDYSGIFNNQLNTDKVRNSVFEEEHAKDEINMIMSKETHDKYFSENREDTELGNKAAARTGIGAAIGGAIGALIAMVAAVGTSVVIPGLDVVIAGPLAAALAGAGAGGIVGGLTGALVGWMTPQERVKLYESGIKGGHIISSTKPGNDDSVENFDQNRRNKDHSL